MREAEGYIEQLNKERMGRIEAVKKMQEGMTQQEAEKITKLQQ